MDYGYQLLRHVVQQVFGNLVSAARITLVLIIIPIGIVLATNPGLLTGAAFSPATGEIGNVTGIGILGILIAILAGVVCWLWAAVAWHRFVLLEEYPTGLFPAWRGSNIGNYFGNSILIFLIMIGVGFAVGIVIGILVAVIQSPALALLLGIGLVFGLSWVATRVGLILPAAAIGEKLGIGESWRATAPVAGQIILPIFVLALASTILNQGIIAGFGEATAVETPFGVQQQVTLNGFGVALSLVVTWLQMLLNLALMTTLYGNLIEGRQLN
ncbi:hypothetical protein [Gymnodinialimonas hymeniacidonis]|uniref:hypothetical protein n=1 Tax=Gymnodinialimonas hymeniacidonis TaxID=3126508 RepID=UPI0034C5E952